MPVIELLCRECGFSKVGHICLIPGACGNFTVEQPIEVDEKFRAVNETGLDENGDAMPPQRKGESNESESIDDSPSGVQS